MYPYVQANGWNYVGGSDTPYNACLDSTNSRILMGNNGSGSVRVLSSVDYSLITTVTGMSAGAAFVAYDSTNNRYFVTNSTLGGVYAIAASGFAVTTVITGLTNPNAMYVDIPGNRLFVCHSSGIPVYNLTTFALITTLTVSTPNGIDVDTVNDLLYATQRSANSVKVFTYSTLTASTTISSISNAYGVCLFNDKIIVTNITGGTFYIINKSGYSTYGTVDGLGTVRHPAVIANQLWIGCSANKCAVIDKPFA